MRKISLCALAVIALNSHAQKKSESNTFDGNPFDSSLNNLPIAYKGHDCKSISSTLKKLKIEKDEFETTADFDSRIAAIQDKKLYSKISVGDLLAFKRGGNQDVSVKYSADDRILYIEAKPMIYGTVVNGKMLTWDNINVSSKDSYYRGSNAYGATVNVRKTDLQTCSLAFSNVKRDLLGTIDVVLTDIPPELARRAKSGVSYFYIGKLEQPYIAKVYDSTPAKIDWPFETNWRGDALVFKLMHAWVVENKTGEVLGKRDF